MSYLLRDTFGNVHAVISEGGGPPREAPFILVACEWSVRWVDFRRISFNVRSVPDGLCKACRDSLSSQIAERKKSDPRGMW